MKTKDLMTVDVATLDPDASLEEAARLMGAADVAVIPIVENGRAVGILTDRDIVVRALAKGLSPDETAVGDIMTCELIACGEDDDVQDVRRRMSRRRVRRMLVLDADGALKGMLKFDEIAARTAVIAAPAQAARALVDVG